MAEVLIAPSVLSADFARLGDDMLAVERAGADWIHLDVMDGRFVPNITFGPPVIAKLRALTGAVFDAHLMIEEPDALLGDFVAAGCDVITVHAEACRHLDRTLQRIRESGRKAGVALNPATPPGVLRHVLDRLDLVLVMTVNPGFGGQAFIPAMTAKIAETATMLEGRDIRLQVDGGIAPATAGAVTAAGADVLVAGSAIFGKGDEAGYRHAIAGLREAARQGAR